MQSADEVAGEHTSCRQSTQAQLPEQSVPTSFSCLITNFQATQSNGSHLIEHRVADIHCQSTLTLRPSSERVWQRAFRNSLEFCNRIDVEWLENQCSMGFSAGCKPLTVRQFITLRLLASFSWSQIKLATSGMPHTTAHHKNPSAERSFASSIRNGETLIRQ